MFIKYYVWNYLIEIDILNELIKRNKMNHRYIQIYIWVNEWIEAFDKLSLKYTMMNTHICKPTKHFRCDWIYFPGFFYPFEKRMNLSSSFCSHRFAIVISNFVDERNVFFFRFLQSLPCVLAEFDEVGLFLCASRIS